MFRCTLRLDPQVFTGSCLVITGQWAGYWCCRRPLGWIQAITATERGRLFFSSPTPPSPRRSRVLLLLALHWPRFSPHPTAELQTNQQQKTSVWRYLPYAGVCARGGWQFAGTISRSAVLSGRDPHSGPKPQPWCYLLWMSAWHFRGFMSEVSFLQLQ